MKYYRLEYNPNESKLFHMDNYTHQQNTFAWTTVDEKAEDRTATRFIAYFKKYHTDKTYDVTEVTSMWRLFAGLT